MSLGALVSLDEYLKTSYEPDLEYVDGVLEERNMGDWLHSLIQRNLIIALSRKYPQFYAVPELRSQTKSTRYRLPDVCVLLAPPKTKFLLDAAFLTIEILSEDDKMTKVIEKLDEYEGKGVPNIWLIDPRLRKMSIYSSGDLHEVRGDVMATAALAGGAPIELTRDEIFRQ
jgi:Uma2 family endonuclease